MQTQLPLGERIAAVRQHANANYHNGWFVVAEHWSDADIAEAVAKCWTANGAITEMKRVMAVYEVKNTTTQGA